MRLTDTPSLSFREGEAADATMPAAAAPAPAKAKAAAEKFEAFFVAEMFRKMRSSAKEFGDRDDAQHSRANDDMLDLAHGMVADVIAGRHAFGIADLILRQVLPAPSAPPEVGSGVEFKSPATSVALKE
jgi:flagellar protein FlgJ